MKVVILTSHDPGGPFEAYDAMVAADVAGVLQNLGHSATIVGMRCPPPVLDCDVVFNLCEAVNSDVRLEMAVAAWLSLLGVPYTGNGPEAICRSRDKATTPRPRPPFRVFPSGRDIDARGVEFPLIVKPRRTHSSRGITPRAVVHDEPSLRRQVAWVQREYGDAICEAYIDGRELTVSIIGDAVLAVAEIDFSRLPPQLPRIVTWDGKWVEDSEEYGGTAPFFPDHVPPEAPQIALAAAREAGCHGYTRVDMRIGVAGSYVIDINANPDIERNAGFARAAEHVGFTYEALIQRILDDALERGGGSTSSMAWK